MAFKGMGLRVEPIVTILLSGHTVKCLQMFMFKLVDQGCLVSNLCQRSFFSQWAIVNEEMYNCSKCGE